MKPHDELYYRKEARVINERIKPYPIELSIETTDFKGVPDCKIGHFGYNFYFRTAKGLKGLPYASEAQLEKAVMLSLKKRGFTFIEWVNKN